MPPEFLMKMRQFRRKLEQLSRRETNTRKDLFLAEKGEF
jgi:hypothetical protein